MTNIRIRPSLLLLGAGLLLASCKQQNQYAAPPPPTVSVAKPVQQEVTRYLEATGNTQAFNQVDLVARVQGFLQDITYQDGSFVKLGTNLFTIEPLPYQAKLEQAQAQEAATQAQLTQAETEYQRQATLGHNSFSSQSVVDQALATRDTDRANLAQAKASTQLAAIDYTYTHVTAPFDGIVTAHMESVGQLVGGNTPTKLATIVQLQPIYVVFTISEQDVLRIRATIAGKGLTRADLAKVPVEVGLQTETGYPHQGKLDYAAPMVDPNTGTLLVRGELANADRALLPGYFVRVRVPLGRGPALLVPDDAIGADQGGNYVLVVNGDNVVAQRSVTTGPLEGTLRVIETGLKPDDRVVVAGLQRAIPGEHVVPQEQVAEAVAPTAKP